MEAAKIRVHLRDAGFGWLEQVFRETTDLRQSAPARSATFASWKVCKSSRPDFGKNSSSPDLG
jgi:hypothetical protein